MSALLRTFIFVFACAFALNANAQGTGLKAPESTKPKPAAKWAEKKPAAEEDNPGVKAVEKIFKKLFVPALQDAVARPQFDNPKGTLQEWSQGKWKMSPYYRILSEDGPPHARHFRVEVIVNGKVMGVGEGANKRDAEMTAAETALLSLDDHGALP